MSGAVLLFVAAFLASAVEMVEALTIVLAVGVTRSWRSTNIGWIAAVVSLAILVAIFGPALTAIPLNVLQLVIGTLLLIFGLQWLRKAILRASGHKALHDEAAIFQKEVAAAKAAGSRRRAGLDWYAFTISYKGVFLEGLEVVFIVLTFGSTQQTVLPGAIRIAAAGAALAILLVGLAGVIVHAPLARVPENALKFVVGALLTTFGTFWGAEGAGVHWPGGQAADASIIGILAFVLLCSFGLVALLRRPPTPLRTPTAPPMAAH